MHKESIIGQSRDERIICFSNSEADFQRLSIKNRACDQTAKRCPYICVFKYARTVKKKSLDRGSKQRKIKEGERKIIFATTAIRLFFAAQLCQIAPSDINRPTSSQTSNMQFCYCLVILYNQEAEGMIKDLRCLYRLCFEADHKTYSCLFYTCTQGNHFECCQSCMQLTPRKLIQNCFKSSTLTCTALHNCLLSKNLQRREFTCLT